MFNFNQLLLHGTQSANLGWSRCYPIHRNLLRVYTYHVFDGRDNGLSVTVKTRELLSIAMFTVYWLYYALRIRDYILRTFYIEIKADSGSQISIFRKRLHIYIVSEFCSQTPTYCYKAKNIPSLRQIFVVKYPCWNYWALFFFPHR